MEQGIRLKSQDRFSETNTTCQALRVSLMCVCVCICVCVCVTIFVFFKHRFVGFKHCESEK